MMRETSGAHSQQSNKHEQSLDMCRPSISPPKVEENWKTKFLIYILVKRTYHTASHQLQPNCTNTIQNLRLGPFASTFWASCWPAWIESTWPWIAKFLVITYMIFYPNKGQNGANTCFCTRPLQSFIKGCLAEKNVQIQIISGSSRSGAAPLRLWFLLLPAGRLVATQRCRRPGSERFSTGYG